MTEQQVQRISPVLIYDDADKAMQFLTEAFGFTERGGAPVAGRCRRARGARVPRGGSSASRIG